MLRMLRKGTTQARVTRSLRAPHSQAHLRVHSCTHVLSLAAAACQRALPRSDVSCACVLDVLRRLPAVCVSCAVCAGSHFLVGVHRCDLTLRRRAVGVIGRATHIYKHAAAQSTSQRDWAAPESASLHTEKRVDKPSARRASTGCCTVCQEGEQKCHDVLPPRERRVAAPEPAEPRRGEIGPPRGSIPGPPAALTKQQIRRPHEAALRVGSGGRRRLSGEELEVSLSCQRHHPSTTTTTGQESASRLQD